MYDAANELFDVEKIDDHGLMRLRSSSGKEISDVTSVKLPHRPKQGDVITGTISSMASLHGECFLKTFEPSDL